MSNEIAVKQHQAQPVQKFSFFNVDHFATMQRVSMIFINSELVPDMYRMSDKNPKEKAIANCIIALEMAERIGASPLMVMQNLVVIHGKPTWSSKFLIATVNTSGRYKQLKYSFTNLGKVGKINITEYVWENGKKVAKNIVFDGSEIDNWKCIAHTTEVGNDNDTLESSDVTIAIAIKEGWYTKAGSKWPNMTKKMLIYRAASFWTNEYAPELSLGMKTEEESQDFEDVEYVEVSTKVNETIKVHANKTEMKMDNDPIVETKPTITETKPIEKTEPEPEKNPI